MDNKPSVVGISVIAAVGNLLSNTLHEVQLSEEQKFAVSNLIASFFKNGTINLSSSSLEFKIIQPDGWRPVSQEELTGKSTMQQVIHTTYHRSCNLFKWFMRYGQDMIGRQVWVTDKSGNYYEGPVTIEKITKKGGIMVTSDFKLSDPRYPNLVNHKDGRKYRSTLSRDQLVEMR